MWRLALLIWVLVGTVLAGIAVVVVLVTPELLAEGMKFIPIAGIGGYVVGIPVAFVVTSFIDKAAA